MDYTAQLDYSHSLAGEYIQSFTYPWRALASLRDFILRLGDTLPKEYARLGEGIWVHESAEVAPTVSLTAPCIIGKNTELRQGAFIRGGVLVGDGCVIGNSVELKNCVLFDGVQAPHFNYIGDGILGYKAHLGAGAITSNVRLDKKNITVNGSDTGLRKFGAIVGDRVEVGCNAVLNPGTVLGRGACVYPLVSVRGVVEENTIVKANG